MLQDPSLKHPECFPISIPHEDPFYSAYGVTCMEFVRSIPAERCHFGRSALGICKESWGLSGKGVSFLFEFGFAFFLGEDYIFLVGINCFGDKFVFAVEINF